MRSNNEACASIRIKTLSSSHTETQTSNMNMMMMNNIYHNEFTMPMHVATRADICSLSLTARVQVHLPNNDNRAILNILIVIKAFVVS